MKHSKLKKCLALCMSMLLILAMVPASVFALMDFSVPDGMFLVSQSERVIAPGVIENKIVTNRTDGQSQVMGYAVSVDMSEGSTATLMSGYADYDGSTWKLQTVRHQANAIEQKKGVNVVAAFNADIYNMQTGEPTGNLVMDGTVYKKAIGAPYFAILKDGTPVIGERMTEEVLANCKEALGGFYVLVKNGVKTAYGHSDGNFAPKTAIGIKADGDVILYNADGRNVPISVGLNDKDLADIMIGLGCVDVLNFDGGGSATYAAEYEGSGSLEVANVPSDGAERKVASSIFVVSSAKPTGVFDHASLTPNSILYTPGSEVQFSATGVDSSGGVADLPEDGFFALVDDSFGTITADGLFTSSGKTGRVTVNYVAGDKVCGSTFIDIVVPDTFYVPNNDVSLGFEQTTDFGIVAKYKMVDVVMKSGDINWSITDEEGNDLGETAGSFDGLTFTTVDGVTINAVISATLAFDESVTTVIKAVIGAMPVVRYDFEYTTDAAEAEANPDLEWIPSYQMPYFDRSTGETSQQQAAKFYEQGYPFYSWPNQSLTDQTSMKTSIVSKADGEPVRFGEHSLKIEYNYESYNGDKNSNNYLRVTVPDCKFEGTPTAIGVWVYVPKGTADFVLYPQCTGDMDGAQGNLYQGFVIDWTGWKYIEMPLNPAKAPYGFYQSTGMFWISFQTNGGGDAMLGDRTASKIYLDNWQLVYGANTADTDNPVVTSIKADINEIEDGVTVFDSNVNTFRASYADVEGKYATGINFNEVRMFIDGVDVTDRCFINEGDEEIYFYDAYLANGKHNIEISVTDNYGNTTTERRTFTVAGEVTNDTVLDYVALDEAPILGSVYTTAITANDISDINSVDVSVKIYSNLINYWNKFTVEAGDGFELEGEAEYDTKEDAINFKVVKKSGAAVLASELTGNDIIAKIKFNIPNNIPEGLKVTYEIVKGEVEYSSAKDEKFVGGFYGAVSAEPKSPLVVAVDTMVVGSAGGNIVVKDTDGNVVAGAEVKTESGELIGTTDENGVVFTDKFVSSVAEYAVYAESEGRLSFVCKSQSFNAGGSEDGMPTFLKLNATTSATDSKNISWMSNPITSADKAVVLYATKADYDAQGDAALKTFEGKSLLKEMSSSADIQLNYAVRINSALITGLLPETEYVFKAGDGTNMTEISTFKTHRKGTNTNFFVLGDTQANDTTNTDIIANALSASGIDFDFGLQTGDAVDNGGKYELWANIAKIFSGDFFGSKDIIHVLGNHEYYGDDGATSSAAYFNLPDSEDGTAPICYSVQYGNVYVAVVNFVGTKNYRLAAEWLKEDAAASNATWKVLSMHQPSYYTNPTGGSDLVREIFVPVIDEVGIDFVFSGHDHSYARTKPMTAGAVDEKAGTVYYICGSTGEKSYDVVYNDEFNFVIATNDYEATYLTVSADEKQFSVTTYDLDGSVLDSYTMKKDNECSKNGHTFVYGEGYLECTVCGHAKPLGEYNGFATDAATGRTMYFIGGVSQKGWYTNLNDCYYFDENGLAVTGKNTIDGIEYNFAEDGKQIGAAFVKDSDGVTRAYRGGALLKGWQEIDGSIYYFSRTDGAMRTGKTTVTLRTNQKLEVIFSEDGKLLRGAFYTTEDGTVYYWGSEPVSGWQEIEGKKYYFSPIDNYMATDNTEIDGQMYAFAMDGTFMHEGAHTWEKTLTLLDPNCNVEGKDTYVCRECSTTKDVDVPALGHIDEDGNGRCDRCLRDMEHNSNFENFFYTFFNRILNFFKSLFKSIFK